MITKRKLMDLFTGTAAIIAALGGLLLGFPPAYKVIADYRLALEDKKVQAAKAKLEDDQAHAELAQKLGVPEQSTARMLSVFVNRLDQENVELKGRVTTLEAGRVERDEQIKTLQTGQEQSEARIKEMVEANEKLVKENDELRKENAQLKTDNATIKQDNATIKAQLRTMIRELQKAKLPLPDGVEHGEENGGGTG